MNATRYTGLIHSLALALLVSTVVPCGLMELVAESFCTDPPLVKELVFEGGFVVHGPATAPAASDNARLVSIDCCTGCITCCASYTETDTLAPLSLTGVSTLPGFFMAQAPPGSPLSIWRPPRS